jgi:tetratricopeptide (TPR) repeat protein
MVKGSVPYEMTNSTSYEIKLEKGIEAFYKSDWQQAKSIFSDLQSRAPNDPRAYFFDSMIPFWEYYFGGKSRHAAKEFLECSQKAISISQTQLQQNPHDTTTVLMLSGLYGYRSLVAASEKEYRTAIESGMTGFKYTRQLLALDADDPKALIGKGLFYYMLGSVPDGLKWVTNMVGMSGDTQQGFASLKKAAQSDTYVSNDARMILAYLYEREKKYQKAISYLVSLTKKYPQNIIFQYNQARLHEKLKQLPEARKKYKHVLAMEIDGMQLLKDQSRSRLQKL